MSGVSVPGKLGLEAEGAGMEVGTIELGAGTSEVGAATAPAALTPESRGADALAGETELGDDSSMGPSGGRHCRTHPPEARSPSVRASRTRGQGATVRRAAH